MIRARRLGLGLRSVAVSVPVIVLVLVGAPQGVRAQSLLAGDGLGLPAEPLDGRSRALGGAGIGLSGTGLLERDPAASAGIPLSTATLTFQTSTSTPQEGETAGHTRFPTIAASYPYRGNVFTVLVASFLDQEWEARVEQTLDIGGVGVEAVDRFRSTGGVARASFGWARQVLESLSAGVTFGSYVGTTQRSFTRSLDPEVVGGEVEPFVTGRRLQASGVLVGVGVAWDPTQIVHVAGSATWSDDLTLSPSDEDSGEKKTYRIPLELRAGGTVTLTAGLALHLGLTYADWTDTGADLSMGSSRGGTWSYGGGLEWSGGTIFGRAAPIRLGARHRDLPFHSAGAEATERSLSGGFGIDLVETEGLPLARFDVGVERGSREAGTLSEDFWRTVVSVRVAAG